MGTLEELMEIITWKQLGLYADPIVILNTRGYFNPLKEMLERAVEEKFMREIHRNLWSIADTPRQAADLIRNTPQWDAAISKMAQM